MWIVRMCTLKGALQESDLNVRLRRTDSELTSGSQHRRLRAQRSEFARSGLITCVPDVVAGQRQVFPPERRHMLHDLWSDTQVFSREFQIPGVPENNGRDHEVEPGSAIDLVFEGAVSQFAELAEEDRTGE